MLVFHILTIYQYSYSIKYPLDMRQHQLVVLITDLYLTESTAQVLGLDRCVDDVLNHLLQGLPQNPKTPYVSDVRELYLIYSFVQIYSSMSSQRLFGASRTAMRHDPQLLKYVLLLRYG